MPGLTVFREDENGRRQADLVEPGFDLRILDRATASSHCLRFVDPYGDTVFNQLQLPVLEAELEAVAVVAPELGPDIAILLEFLRASHAPHIYVRIYGD